MRWYYALRAPLVLIGLIDLVLGLIALAIGLFLWPDVSGIFAVGIGVFAVLVALHILGGTS